MLKYEIIQRSFCLPYTLFEFSRHFGTNSCHVIIANGCIIPTVGVPLTIYYRVQLFD